VIHVVIHIMANQVLQVIVVVKLVFALLSKKVNANVVILVDLLMNQMATREPREKHGVENEENPTMVTLEENLEEEVVYALHSKKESVNVAQVADLVTKVANQLLIHLLTFPQTEVMLEPVLLSKKENVIVDPIADSVMVMETTLHQETILVELLVAMVFASNFKKVSVIVEIVADFLMTQMLRKLLHLFENLVSLSKKVNAIVEMSADSLTNKWI